MHFTYMFVSIDIFHFQVPVGIAKDLMGSEIPLERLDDSKNV